MLVKKLILLFKKKKILKHGPNIKKFVFSKKKQFIYFINNCSIITNSVDDAAYVTNNNIIQGPSYQYRNSINTSVKNNFIFNKLIFKFKRKIKGNLISIISGGAAKHNYGHWLFDVLSRLLIIKKIYHFKFNDYFYVPALKYQFQIDSLNYLNIKKKQIISSEENKHIYSNKIICTDHPFFHRFDLITKKILLDIRGYFLKFKKKSKIKSSKKIFINRDYSRFNLNKNYIIKYKDERILLNHKKIQTFLFKKGFKTFTLNKKSFADQIKIFSDAKIIISLYGAELSNLVFCSPKTRVIEIKNINKNYDFLNISKKLSLRHTQINLKPIFKSNISQNGIINCPIKLLDKALKKIL